MSSRPVSRLRRCDALTLVEVVFAMAILTISMLGILQSLLQSRRMTEASVRQASIASFIQGYMEQFKSVPFAADSGNKLPCSPSTSPGTAESDWTNYLGDPDSNPTLPCKNALQDDILICLAVSPAPTSLPDISTLPTNASMHSETVDIDGVTTANLKMWVWVTDMGDGANVVNCKSIIIVYQWDVKDGGRTRYYSDMLRTIRSVVPTQ